MFVSKIFPEFFKNFCGNKYTNASRIPIRIPAEKADNFIFSYIWLKSKLLKSSNVIWIFRWHSYSLHFFVEHFNVVFEIFMLIWQKKNIAKIFGHFSRQFAPEKQTWWAIGSITVDRNNFFKILVWFFFRTSLISMLKVVFPYLIILYIDMGGAHIYEIIK